MWSALTNPFARRGSKPPSPQTVSTCTAPSARDLNALGGTQTSACRSVHPCQAFSVVRIGPRAGMIAACLSGLVRMGRMRSAARMAPAVTPGTASRPAIGRAFAYTLIMIDTRSQKWSLCVA